ncbi:MAG: hypothetical protein MJZ15_05030 [Bacteroidales bacterium]|nr:hypothetical protein [Bacteroidales bacterium]
MKTQLLLFFAFASTLSSAQVNAYIDRVYEYRPAPGQFINTMPAWEDGDDELSMAKKAEDLIANNNGSMICLGGFGGYVVFGFDHMIKNVEGHYDFTVLGNAFYQNGLGEEGGSCEPGVVMVSRDENENGIPDDKWYELAGSEYYKSKTRHNFTITYFRTPEDHVATPDQNNKSLVDTSFVAWKTSTGGTGHIYKNSFHRQNYYPNWIKDDQYSFTGTLLANNAVDASGKGTNYILYSYGYGYVDNHPNTDAKNRSKFNIDWAVDAEGNRVVLDGVDFVKVYTALNQYAGWLGETSTEVANAWDLHMKGGDDVDEYWPREVKTEVETIMPEGTTREIYDITGRRVDGMVHKGVYIIREGGKVKKAIIK